MTKTFLPCSLMLDSGSFGSWRRGIKLPLKDYIKFVKRHSHFFSSHVNMDVIPGSKGLMIRTPEAVESSAQASYTNLQILKDAGLEPIPVFHQGERFDWLEKLLDDGEPYIGISPYLRSHPREIRQWLDRVFTLTTDRKGNPVVKTHGFGMTNPALILRYPWHTVDSTSWAIGAGYGNIKIPIYKNGEPDWTQPPIQMPVTGINDNRRQFEGLGPLTQASINKFIEAAGTNITAVRNTTHARMRVYITYYLGLEKAAQNVKFIHRDHGLDASSQETIERKAIRLPFNIIYASTPHAIKHNVILNSFQVRNRLLSYFDLKDKREDFVECYVTTGLPNLEKSRIPKQRWHSEEYKSHRRMQIADRIEEAE